jgi:adenylate cyclase class 2
MYEVELKFPLADPRPVLDRIAAWGAESGGTIEQCDLYFRHPQRDFGQTDEALRVRSAGEFNCVTYKGPVVDSRTKTRREIEVPLAEGAEAALRFSEILTHLGFLPVRSVRKTRTLWHLVWQDRQFEIAVDDVTDLGPYLEIETQSDDAGRAAAGQAILTLASKLGLPRPEPTSYLGLLLARDRDGNPP